MTTSPQKRWVVLVGGQQYGPHLGLALQTSSAVSYALGKALWS